MLGGKNGRTIGEFEVAVCDPATGAPRPMGEVGEVRVRGHLVMQGYYRTPQATAQALPPDGWFRPGHLGQIDAEA